MSDLLADECHNHNGFYVGVGSVHIATRFAIKIEGCNS
jgi:hypothetical protein